ncbi:MAG TPA: hypothetical protein VK358_03720 [Longimicrobium sp.]|nr:hypothetical protein [Longimicrobium sp.]
MKLPVIALAALGAALFFAAPAAAQPDIIRTQLDSATVLMSGNGFRLQDDIVSGDLRQGQDEEFELELEGGKSYIIVGVCDGDCTDLDMALTTAAGADVDSDYEDDDFPMVMVEVESGATYNLKVQMAACSVEPCAYGVGVYANNQ